MTTKKRLKMLEEAKRNAKSEYERALIQDMIDRLLKETGKAGTK